jgi:hypothetical protein
MHAAAIAAGLFLIFGVLLDAFETIVLPRRVSRRVRLASMFLRVLWAGWSGSERRRRDGNLNENYLGFYGPLSLLLLIALWAAGLVLGFGLLQWGLRSPLSPDAAAGTLPQYLYLSGTTFFTLGLGDVAPLSAAGRTVMVLESGAGFIFLALVIGYLPVLYQSFSRREVRISMLDEWAGSPPSAVELLRRTATHGSIDSIDRLLADWEQGSADLLESHLSYPILAYFRSQHDNESWVSALSTVLDLSALVLAGIEGPDPWQARRTFAMCRHAAVDLAQVTGARPQPQAGAMSPEDLSGLTSLLKAAGVRFDERLTDRFAKYRDMYEPYVRALGARLAMPLPPLLPIDGARDNWKTSAWGTPLA